MAVHRDCGNREDLHQEARVATSTAAASVRFLTPRTSIALDQPRDRPLVGGSDLPHPGDSWPKTATRGEPMTS
jgi:hypothetical protein